MPSTEIQPRLKGRREQRAAHHPPGPLAGAAPLHGLAWPCTMEQDSQRRRDGAKIAPPRRQGRHRDDDPGQQCLRRGRGGDQGAVGGLGVPSPSPRSAGPCSIDPAPDAPGIPDGVGPGRDGIEGRDRPSALEASTLATSIAEATTTARIPASGPMPSDFSRNPSDANQRPIVRRMIGRPRSHHAPVDDPRRKGPRTTGTTRRRSSPTRRPCSGRSDAGEGLGDRAASPAGRRHAPARRAPRRAVLMISCVGRR